MVLLAGVVSGILHGPLLASFGTSLPGEAASDIFRAHWSAWLLGTELPGWPYGSLWANFPDGIEILPFPAVGLSLFAPISRLGSPAVSVSLLVMTYTIFGMWSGWYLVRTLGGGLGGGLVAGVGVYSHAF